MADKNKSPNDKKHPRKEKVHPKDKHQKSPNWDFKKAAPSMGKMLQAFTNVPKAVKWAIESKKAAKQTLGTVKMSPKSPKTSQTVLSPPAPIRKSTRSQLKVMKEATRNASIALIDKKNKLKEDRELPALRVKDKQFVQEGSHLVEPSRELMAELNKERTTIPFISHKKIPTHLAAPTVVEQLPAPPSLLSSSQISPAPISTPLPSTLIEMKSPQKSVTQIQSPQSIKSNEPSISESKTKSDSVLTRPKIETDVKITKNDLAISSIISVPSITGPEESVKHLQTSSAATEPSSQAHKPLITQITSPVPKPKSRCQINLKSQSPTPASTSTLPVPKSLPTTQDPLSVPVSSPPLQPSSVPISVSPPTSPFISSTAIPLVSTIQAPNSPSLPSKLPSKQTFSSFPYKSQTSKPSQLVSAKPPQFYTDTSLPSQETTLASLSLEPSSPTKSVQKTLPTLNTADQIKSSEGSKLYHLTSPIFSTFAGPSTSDKKRTYLSVGPNQRKVKLENLMRTQKYKDASHRLNIFSDTTYCGEGDCNQLLNLKDALMHRQFECRYAIETCERCRRFNGPKLEVQMHRYLCQMLRYDDLPPIADEQTTTSFVSGSQSSGSPAASQEDAPAEPSQMEGEGSLLRRRSKTVSRFCPVH